MDEAEKKLGRTPSWLSFFHSDESFHWATALAVGVPMLVWLATAAPHGYWLDSGEFVAQAADFGIAHPPGEGLYGLLATLWVWLCPFGPLPFRLAVFSAVLAGVASYSFYEAAQSLYRQILGGRRHSARWIALAATWAFAFAPGWWSQANRPEVYALQAALTGIVLRAVCSFEEEWPGESGIRIYLAGWWWGLSLANHHFLAFVLLPSLAATLARLRLQQSPLLPLLGSVLLGALSFLYLPLRAGRAQLNLGNPDSLERFWWVVSAEVFQKNQGSGIAQPIGERIADVVEALFAGLGPVVLLLGMAGSILVLRRQETRRIGAIFVVVTLSFAAARVWLGFVRSNPDALGYLMPAFASLSILAGAALTFLVQTLPRLRTPIVVLSCLGLLGVAGARRSEVSLRRFADTDVFDALSRRRLPERSIAILHDPQSVFAYWGAQSVDLSREDVVMIPVPFLGYPSVAESVGRQAPEARVLLAEYVLSGTLHSEYLQALATERPVFLELDPRLGDTLDHVVAADGLLFRVYPGGATAMDRTSGFEKQHERWEVVLRNLKMPLDEETRRRIVWQMYVSASFYFRVGEFAAAKWFLMHCDELAPQDREIDELMRSVDVELERPEDSD